MVTLQIDLSDVLDGTDENDHVMIWAPSHREGSRGQLVTPRKRRIDLEAGKATVEVEPGPLNVQIQAQSGRVDKDVRRLIVPEEGPVTLRAMMEDAGAFTYTPEIITAVTRMRTDAVEAREGALGSEEAAAESATAAAASATSAGESATSAGVSATTSDDAAAVAVAALVAAEQEAQEVRQISEMQFIGDGFPNGVVAAPVGAVYTDRLATNGAIRWIKTSGTGNTGWEVEWGDTGLRRVDALFPEFDCTTAGHHGIYVRRVGPTVYVYGTGIYIGTSNHFGPMLHTIIGRPQPHYLASIGVAVNTTDPDVRYVANGSHSTRLNFNVTPKQSSASTAFHAVYSTERPAWPTTLPGIPA